MKLRRWIIPLKDCLDLVTSPNEFCSALIPLFLNSRTGITI